MATKLLRLPEDRHLQIQALARLREVTMADLVGSLVEKELRIERQNRRFITSSYEASWRNGKIYVSIPNFGDLNLSREQARQLIDAIDQAISGRTSTIVLQSLSVKVGRLGRGMLFEMQHSNGRKTRKTTGVSVFSYLLEQLRNVIAR